MKLCLRVRDIQHLFVRDVQIPLEVACSRFLLNLQRLARQLIMCLFVNHFILIIYLNVLNFILLF
jgi:hypothetical protein